MDQNNTQNNALNLTERLINLIRNLSDEKQQNLLDLLLEWQQDELRSDQRIPCLIAVDYSTKERVYRDFIQDLSKGGVFIETREPFQVGQLISLTFNIPNSDKHFKVLGKIIRTQAKGIAVQFSNKLSQYQEESIKKAIDIK